MSAVATLRSKAAQLAEQLTQAEANHAAEQRAIGERNAERRHAFWTNVHTDTLPAAVQAMQDARAAFGAAVATGGDIAAAYVAYVRAHAAHRAINNAVCSGLVVMVDRVTGAPTADGSGRPTYPGTSPSHSEPAEFVAMLNQATAAAGKATTVATLAELRTSLEAELEAEDDG